jgi:hypothetical protein
VCDVQHLELILSHRWHPSYICKKGHHTVGVFISTVILLMPIISAIVTLSESTQKEILNSLHDVLYDLKN